MAKKVLVTGATGRTGSLVFQKLQQHPEFEASGFARSAEKVTALHGNLTEFTLGSILERQDLDRAIAPCNALVILTSAAPVINSPPAPGQPPQFTYPPGQFPENVDYHGQVNQIEAAKKASIEHIVLVGSMGGTNPNHPLNKMGNGNILVSP